MTWTDDDQRRWEARAWETGDYTAPPGYSDDTVRAMDRWLARSCTCPGHRMTGVHHIAACCDQPHMTAEEERATLS